MTNLFKVLFVVFGGLCILGLFGLPWLTDWVDALRIAVATMFVVGAFAHFGKYRAHLIQMVPPNVPRPVFVIALIGILELVGGLALLWPPTRPWASLGLTLLLMCVLPAHFRAAELKLMYRGKPFPSLLISTLLHVVFVFAVLAVG
ncbi:DoxX family membrane protein [Bacillaceae bacterium SIJ1]|uniref:DoxX family protein n=1 Tax=Litoribacterium kuwaitense TaxID=1398745 RepID=UPI0013EE1657|nr:DoxX family protein [Litoribacterium kuwaitense]NGP46112.1 DoxX family membrane protein [Litoribacterium kuwaitense]